MKGRSPDDNDDDVGNDVDDDSMMTKENKFQGEPISSNNALCQEKSSIDIPLL